MPNNQVSVTDGTLQKNKKKPGSFLLKDIILEVDVSAIPNLGTFLDWEISVTGSFALHGAGSSAKIVANSITLSEKGKLHRKVQDSVFAIILNISGKTPADYAESYAKYIRPVINNAFVGTVCHEFPALNSNDFINASLKFETIGDMI